MRGASHETRPADLAGTRTRAAVRAEAGARDGIHGSAPEPCRAPHHRQRLVRAGPGPAGPADPLGHRGDRGRVCGCNRRPPAGAAYRAGLVRAVAVLPARDTAAFPDRGYPARRDRLLWYAAGPGKTIGGTGNAGRQYRIGARP